MTANRRPVFSADGRWLLLPIGTRGLGLYATGTWKRKHTLTGDTTDSAEVVFSPDGRRILGLFSGLNGQDVKVWDTESGQELLAFSRAEKQSIRKASEVYFDGNRFVASRRLLATGEVQVETLDGTSVPDAIARERLGVK
jgi:WD40 repeat protein